MSENSEFEQNKALHFIAHEYELSCCNGLLLKQNVGLRNPTGFIQSKWQSQL